MLASNRLVLEPGAPYLYPYSVDVSVSPLPAKVGFSEGDAHGAHGSVVCLDEALSGRWDEHFAKAEAEWLLPYLLRLQAGGRVEEFELIADFERRNGYAPRTVESQGE